MLHIVSVELNLHAAVNSNKGSPRKILAICPLTRIYPAVLTTWWFFSQGGGAAAIVVCISKASRYAFLGAS